MKNDYFLNPTDLLLRPAEVDGSNYGIVENAHGDVSMYRPQTEAAAALCAHLKYDGNSPLVVDTLDHDTWQAVLAVLRDENTISFNVQDPEYAGWYENICFFDTEEENTKWHAIHFVEYIRSNGYTDADVDLEAIYADYLFDLVHHDK